MSFCKELITEARKTGRNLTVEIKECKRWRVICVDPEHLTDKIWREVTEDPVFRKNIVFGCVDEAHLIYEWGLGEGVGGRKSVGKIDVGFDDTEYDNTSSEFRE